MSWCHCSLDFLGVPGGRAQCANRRTIILIRRSAGVYFTPCRLRLMQLASVFLKWESSVIEMCRAPTICRPPSARCRGFCVAAAVERRPAARSCRSPGSNALACYTLTPIDSAGERAFPMTGAVRQDGGAPSHLGRVFRRPDEAKNARRQNFRRRPWPRKTKKLRRRNFLKQDRSVVVNIDQAGLDSSWWAAAVFGTIFRRKQAAETVRFIRPATNRSRLFNKARPGGGGLANAWGGL